MAQSGSQSSELPEKERAWSHIDVDHLSEIHSTKGTLIRQDNVLAILQADPIVDKTRDYFDGRIDRFRNSTG